METDIKAHYREIAYSLLTKSKTLEKGVVLMGVWRDETHFQNWLNNVDIEKNGTIKLVKEKLESTKDVVVILAISNKPDHSDIRVIYDMMAE